MSTLQMLSPPCWLGISPSRLLVYQGIPPWPLYLEALVVIPFVALKCFRWAGSLSCLGPTSRCFDIRSVFGRVFGWIHSFMTIFCRYLPENDRKSCWFLLMLGSNLFFREKCIANVSSLRRNGDSGYRSTFGTTFRGPSIPACGTTRSSVLALKLER